MKASEDLPRHVVDQGAETFDELFSAGDLTESELRKFIKQMVSTGKWEKVRKLDAGGRARYAYRRTV